MNLTDKVAIVTGSSRGFGAKISETFNGYGAKTVITFLDGDEDENGDGDGDDEEVRAHSTIQVNKNYLLRSGFRSYSP